MKNQHRFFFCTHCGNLVGMIHHAGPDIHCCGEPMVELVPNTSDGAGEKHVPVVTVKGTTVTVEVGEVTHPMLDEHFIMWIYLQTAQGGQRKALLPGEPPRAVFELADGDKAVAAFEYCNIHGLWMAAI